MSIQQLFFASSAAAGPGFQVTNLLEDVFSFSAAGDSSTVVTLTSRAGCFGRGSNFNYENYVWICNSDDLRKYTWDGSKFALTLTTDSPLNTNILGCADNGTHVLLCDSNGNAALYNKATDTFGSIRATGAGNAQGVSWDGTQWIITSYSVEETVYRVNADNTSTLGSSVILDGTRKRGNAYDFNLDRHWVFADGTNDETFTAWDGSSFGTPQDWDDYDSNVTTTQMGNTTADEGDIFATTTGEKFLVQFDNGVIRVIAKLANAIASGGSGVANAGHAVFTTPGTTSWTAPAGVTSVCVVCVGGGGAGGAETSYCGGGGGGLAWRNNISVTPGTSYTVVVGAGGAGVTSGDGNDGGDSYFNTTSTVRGHGGPGGTTTVPASGGGFTTVSAPDGGGGNGGGTTSLDTDANAGAGAGGYSGDGGSATDEDGNDGSGGGGGAGEDGHDGKGGANELGGGGGGTGIYGEGASGAGGASAGDSGFGGGGGSPAYDTGTAGTDGGSGTGGNGGFPGGGGGHARGTATSGSGGDGAVRIIWGTGRAFPSTNVSTETG